MCLQFCQGPHVSSIDSSRVSDVREKLDLLKTDVVYTAAAELFCQI